jgi:hypothetical protein
VWVVSFAIEAQQELISLPVQERVALLNAVAKLEAVGPRLPFPHQSAVKGVPGLRELRPRGGRSPWRGFYRQLGDGFVIAAIGPEAQVDQRNFDRAVRAALARIQALEDETRMT